jgi:hypothetical protein
MSDTNYEFEEDVKDQVERNPVRAQLRNLGSQEQRTGSQTVRSYRRATQVGICGSGR